MNEEINPINPQIPPQGPDNPINPVNPMYEEETNTSMIYKIVLGVLGFLLLVALIFIIVYYKKATKTTAFINQKVEEAKGVKETEVRSACELEKTDIRENPWTNYTARDDFGAFKFVVPRNWSLYEVFDINANNPYSLYFHPEIVSYDTKLRKNHVALEMTISKKLYAAEVKDIQEDIKRNKDTNKTEEAVVISNFTGTKFIYYDKELGRRVGVILLPYRDRALFIKTDDYDKWNEKYYDKFYKSFALTP